MINEYFEGAQAHDPCSIDFGLFIRVAKYILILMVIGFALSFFWGCSTASVLKEITHPIETTTVQGAPVKEVQPPAEMDRKDVPIGVDPDKVILHVSDKEGNEVWEVKTGVLGLGKPKTYTKDATAPVSKKGTAPSGPAPTDDLSVNIAKPSHAWIWCLAGITGLFALLWFGNKAITGFLGFNPIALFGGFISGIIEKFKPKAKTEATGIEVKAQVAAQNIVSSETGIAMGLLMKICAKVKAFISKKIGGKA